MKKKLILPLVILIIFALTPVMISQLPPTQGAKETETAENNFRDKNFRGVWVATVANIDYPSKKGLSAGELKSEADRILDAAKDLNMTAVFLQVRPAGDALYPSRIFPPSEFISGTQGEAPTKTAVRCLSLTPSLIRFRSK